ncbi:MULTISPECIES: glycosyltransferase family 4 protein [Streptomyces]
MDVLLRRWVEVRQNERAEPLSPVSRLRIEREIAWWRSAHRRVSRGANLLVLSNVRDRTRFGKARVALVPNTYAPPSGSPSPRSGGPRSSVLLFQGFLTYPPNVDAARWLVEDIAPLVREKVPNLRVVLAGRCSDRVRALARHPGVEVTDDVEDMGLVVRQADVVCVPLRVGAGTRIKILEAFAHGVAVVSTSVGAEGLDVVAGEHLELADVAGPFADACVRLLLDTNRRTHLAKTALSLYEKNYQPKSATDALVSAVEGVLSDSKRRSS